MLTADLVRTRSRGGELQLILLDARTRTRALEIAEHLLRCAEDAVGHTRAELLEEMESLSVSQREQKLLGALRKLVLDKCAFEVSGEPEPSQLRRQVFLRASKARQGLEQNTFSRDEVLTHVAQEHQLAPDELDRMLYADLPSEHRLLKVEDTRPKILVDNFDLYQAQAVLLRATSVTVELSGDADAYRTLLRELKFRRLLFTFERCSSQSNEAYRLHVDGPLSLFSASTKYGMQLALVLPALQLCRQWQLRAQLRWGAARRPTAFRLSKIDVGQASPLEATHLREDVRALLAGFAEHKVWQARPAETLLEGPANAICVPDVLFIHRPTGKRVFVEVLGYWSRQAVWKRVDLARSGLSERVLFAYSTRLRVSEAALEDELPAALYAYKGSINPKQLEEKLHKLLTARS